ncbi:MAG TPA: MoaD/ThiS family protein [Chryseosolibacter sp.]|nr:MoaD/ThiS family protein [Chryseosolibacter sp.]
MISVSEINKQPIEIMGKYVIKAFGVTKDIIGERETVLELEGDTVASLRHALRKRYPPLAEIRSLMVAVNKAYAGDDLKIGESDEIALIPPVSGG